MEKRLSKNKKLKAYVVGLALGDGNLSNPNGRAVRLRITCDKKYPNLIQNIYSSVQKLFPDNKVAVVNHKRYIDISCYSNKLESILGWKAKGGSKYKQNVSIPHWIKLNKIFARECLRGLLQTDGSIYRDRGYLMVNFVNHTPALSRDVFLLMQKLGFKPNIQKLRNKNGSTKHTIRISKDTERFINIIKLSKS
ncbi:MAG: LAGLIDADG family homing endonuclease [Candidatus Giovannonibacteria bacterium]|nr:MAG: LAGLIDADG family homing endonuclease [Candidatus Giovannonibacteria bacterium]